MKTEIKIELPLFNNGEKVYLKENTNISQIVDDNTKDWSDWTRDVKVKASEDELVKGYVYLRRFAELIHTYLIGSLQRNEPLNERDMYVATKDVLLKTESYTEFDLIKKMESKSFLTVLEENYEAGLTDADRARPSSEMVKETYEDLISIYKKNYR